MKTIDLQKASPGEIHGYLLGAIAPRPIALVSTMDKEGNVNLSPYSFFNIFGTNPPVVVFSPSRRVRDNTTKHSLDNIMETPELVINLVHYNMVAQMSLTSTEYEKGVNEFVKSGFTPHESDVVAPPRVGESLVSLECKVMKVIPVGEEGGAANLVICEILRMHLDEKILDSNQNIDPKKLDLVGRMGANWYCRASGEALFEVERPGREKGIGVDQIPASIRNSLVLTGNDLGKLANISKLPDAAAIEEYGKSVNILEMKQRFKHDLESHEFHLHQYARSLIRQSKIEEAWKVLLQPA